MNRQHRFSISGIICFLVASLQMIGVSQEDHLELPGQVEKIFVQRCFECHSGETAESGFRLDVGREKVFAGGDSEESAIVPGDPDQGSLLRWITAKDEAERMPPDGEPLSTKQIKLIRAWIAKGAEIKSAFAKSDKRLWSLKPVRKASASQTFKSRQAKNSVDTFIERKLIEKGLEFNPDEKRETLIRRLYLVALGIPPSPDEVRQFVNDSKPDAYEKLVDRVLSSTGFGERWAQHWLDIIRFGETHGFETNRERPNAWHFRDYVIESLNADKPYDQFVQEQIAGDQMGSPVATGFIVAGPHDIVKSPDINLTLMQRQDELADIVNVAGTTFLGLTLGCARCHNHKFDPITQKDFYSVQAVFAGVQHADKSLPPERNNGDKVADLTLRIDGLKEKLSRYIPTSRNGTKLRPAINSALNVDKFAETEAKYLRFTIEQSSQSQPCIDELEVFAGEKNVALASLGTIATSNGNFVHPLHKLPHINDGNYGNSKSWIAKNVQGWVQLEFARVERISRVEWARDRTGKFGDRVATRYRIEVATEPDQWRVVSDSSDRMPFQKTPEPFSQYDFSGFGPKEANQGRLWLAELKRLSTEKVRLSRPVQVYAGTFSKPGLTHRLYRGDPFQKREPVEPNTIASLGDLGLEMDEAEANRRMAFARWLTLRENPLVSRVIVNRLWQHTFGRGIVATPNDFGNSGFAPTHPELLDWLASELVESGWSLKHVQRQIYLSHAFRQSSRSNSKGMGVDASCQLLWRFPPRRLEAESIRDSILSVSGVLDRRVGGSGFSGFEVAMENVRHFFPKQNFGPSDWRRMIYMTKVRQERDAVFGAFDCPDASQIIARRSRSTTPLQSLNLLNSTFVLQQADQLGQRLKAETLRGKVSPVSRAYQLLFSRVAEPAEIAEGEAFIKEFGFRAFCRALLNANEFMFIQ